MGRNSGVCLSGWRGKLCFFTKETGTLVLGFAIWHSWHYLFVCVKGKTFENSGIISRIRNS